MTGEQKRKTKLLLIPLFLAALLIWYQFSEDSRLSQPLPSVVLDWGHPTFLAKSTEIQRRRGKILRINVLKQDPRSIDNWQSLSNVIAIWTTSDYCKRNAGYFYNSLRDDPKFDGTAWISSASWFGEKLTILQIENGKVISERKVRVSALSVRLFGSPPVTPRIYR